MRYNRPIIIGSAINCFQALPTALLLTIQFGIRSLWRAQAGLICGAIAFIPAPILNAAGTMGQKPAPAIVSAEHLEVRGLVSIEREALVSVAVIDGAGLRWVKASEKIGDYLVKAVDVEEGLEVFIVNVPSAAGLTQKYHHHDKED